MSKRALFISIFTYFLFFFPVLNPDVVIYSGKDMTSIHYPARFYLHEKLQEGSFPFWTERMYLGFPIYLDLERAFLNIPNIVTTFTFGPVAGFKIQHLMYYLMGSLGFYYFLKKYKVSDLGYFVANLVYFFSFFHLYHQQHFNMIATTYTLPLLLYLIDKYLATRKGLFILLFSLVITNLFYLGSFQALFLVTLVSVIYLLFSSKRKSVKDKKYLNRFLLFVGLFVFIGALPVLQPLLRLYSESARSSSHMFTDGSFSPVMAINAVVPLLFNFDEAYQGVLVAREYFMHETYIYVGATAFIFALFGFFATRKTKSYEVLKKFSAVLVGMFFILAFIKYVPFLNVIGIPVFSLFRYWVRSAFLLSFVVSIFAGIFVSNPTAFKKPTKREIRFLTVPLFFLGFIELINLGKTHTLTFLHVLMRDDFVIGFHNISWLVLLVAFLALLKLFVRAKLKHSFLRSVLIGLLVMDIFLFGRLALTNSFKHQSSVFRPPIFNSSWDNVRLIDLANNYNGNRALFYKSWGLFGYSQFMPETVSNLIYSLGFTSTRHPDLPESLNQTDLMVLYLRLTDLGFELAMDPLDPEKTNLLGGYMIKHNNDMVVLRPEHKEGYFKGQTMSKTNNLAETNIRYDPSWKLWIDEEPAELLKDAKGMFLAFETPQGKHDFELKYVPTAFYVGLGLALFLYGSSLTVLFKTEEKVNAK